MRLATVLVLAISSTFVVRAGALFAYDGFSYPAGASLNGQNGGSGWAGSWSTPGGLDATISSQSLSYGGLGTTGGSVTTAGFQPPNQGSSVATWSRGLSTPLGGDGTTVYLSFLLQPDAGYGFYGGVNFGNVFIGVSGNQTDYGLEGPANDVSLSNVAVVQGQPVLLVLEAQFLAGNDQLSLFVNPTPGQAQPTPSVTKNDLDLGTVTGIVMNNYGGYTTDEIQIGSTFASVTSSVPEPSFRWIFLTVLASMAVQKRRLSSQN